MNKHAFIGASSGIAKAAAAVLSSESHVIGVGRKIEDYVDEFHQIDWRNDELALPQIDELNGLLYAPGTINLKPFHGLKADQFREDFEVNFMGAVRVLQHYRKALKAGNGSVVLVSTVAVQKGMPYHTSVAAAKGAIEGFGRSLAAEWAPDVRVNIVAPSLTDTDLASNLLSNEKKQEASNKRHPLNRYGQPEDLGEMIAFLLSKKSSWITGQTFGVDGGLSTLQPI